MQTMDKTCEERIADHMSGRLADFLAIAELQDADPMEAHPDVSERAKEMANEYGAGDLQEIADDILDSYPLAVSARTVFRVDLSTGGPADWLEVVCSGNTPNYEPAGEGEHYEVERIVYHFADWFDHAERQLTGEDFDAAERFARSVVPELIG